ncbi:MAG: hypothetical protein HY862_10660 [Chloroflexi bacterium]|nr:hypothetical protein [Chloroflexota bacterium]
MRTIFHGAKPINDSYIVTAYCVIADVLQTWEYEEDARQRVSGAEILLVAARYFQNHP